MHDVTNGRERGLSILALMLLLPVPSLSIGVAMWWWPDTVGAKVMFFASKAWLVALPVGWLLWVDGGKMSWSKPTRGGLGVGAALGLAITAVIVVAYFAADAWGWIDRQMVINSASSHDLTNPWVYLAGAIYWITLNSLMEEYVWRWFVFRKAELAFGSVAGVIISALGFTAHHIFALAAQFDWRVTAVASVGVFIGGAAWCWCYLKYRSVWPGYVSHAIVDVPIFVIGYVLIFG